MLYHFYSLDGTATRHLISLDWPSDDAAMDYAYTLCKRGASVQVDSNSANVGTVAILAAS